MALGHVPLPEMLAKLVHERAGSHPEMSFTGEFATLARGYGDTVDLTLYRCVQESLTNAIRHAGAKTVVVQARDDSGPRGTEAGAGKLDVMVRDDGRGIPPGARPGFGLRGMEERVQALGGRFAIETGPDGTSIRIVIPTASRGSADGADYASTAP
jgi:two-component system sensor histidine kinase UhpB